MLLKPRDTVFSKKGEVVWHLSAFYKYYISQETAVCGTRRTGELVHKFVKDVRAVCPECLKQKHLD